MTTDADLHSLRDWLITYMFGHDIPSLADSAMHPIRQWLTSDATVERVARALFIYLLKHRGQVAASYDVSSPAVRKRYDADARELLVLIAGGGGDE